MRRKKGQHWSGTTCRVVSFKLSARSPIAFSKESREATWKSSAFPMCECIQKVRQDLENKILLRLLSREAEWGVTVNMREGSHWPYSSTLICGQMEELKSINYLKWRMINTILRHFGMYSDPLHLNMIFKPSNEATLWARFRKNQKWFQSLVPLTAGNEIHHCSGSNSCIHPPPMQLLFICSKGQKIVFRL